MRSSRALAPWVVVRKGKAFQVIVGMDAPQVRERFETMVNSSKSNV